MPDYGKEAEFGLDCFPDGQKLTSYFARINFLGLKNGNGNQEGAISILLAVTEGMIFCVTDSRQRLIFSSTALTCSVDSVMTDVKLVSLVCRLRGSQGQRGESEVKEEEGRQRRRTIKPRSSRRVEPYPRRGNFGHPRSQLEEAGGPIECWKLHSKSLCQILDRWHVGSGIEDGMNQRTSETELKKNPSSSILGSLAAVTAVAVAVERAAATVLEAAWPILSGIIFHINTAMILTSIITALPPSQCRVSECHS